MKTICLYFEIHHIIHLRRYRFFDIGTDHYYYDDYENENSITDIAERSYMPALNTLLEMIKANGDYFKVAFSLSGVGMEQLEVHAPQVLEKLQELKQDVWSSWLNPIHTAFHHLSMRSVLQPK